MGGARLEIRVVFASHIDTSVRSAAVPHMHLTCTSPASHVPIGSCDAFRSSTANAHLANNQQPTPAYPAICCYSVYHLIPTWCWLHAFPALLSAGKIRICTISASSATCDRDLHRRSRSSSSCRMTGRRTDAPEPVTKRSYDVMIDH
jgi:hypothetical protein